MLTSYKRFEKSLGLVQQPEGGKCYRSALCSLRIIPLVARLGKTVLWYFSLRFILKVAWIFLSAGFFWVSASVGWIAVALLGLFSVFRGLPLSAVLALALLGYPSHAQLCCASGVCCPFRFLELIPAGWLAAMFLSLQGCA